MHIFIPYLEQNKNLCYNNICSFVCDQFSKLQGILWNENVAYVLYWNVI